MNLLFDLLLLGLANPFMKKPERDQRKLYTPPARGRTNSMECLAFDSLNAQAKFRYEKPDTQSEDAYFDGGPDW